MSDFPHDAVKPYGAGGKKEQVSRMFDSIAGRYDFLNRFLSLGTDKGWRRMAIRVLKKERPQVILDVATGTADMAIRAAFALQPQKNCWHRYFRKNAGNRATKGCRTST